MPHQQHNEPTPGQEPTVWVPESLRPPQSRLWHLADNTTYGFGTPLGKVLPPWRWPANITSWKSLRRKHDGIACHRNAHLVVTELTEDNAGHTRSPMPGLIAAVLVALGVGVEVAILLAVIASVPALILCISILGALLFYVVASTTEILYTGRTGAKRRPLRRAGLTKIREAGHKGPVGFGDGYVSRTPGDGRELLRLWLEHVDAAGIALVIDARDDELAGRYAKSNFLRVGADPLLMYRLPYQSSRQQPEP
jgi:uncharacterized membrane protein YqjE